MIVKKVSAFALAILFSAVILAAPTSTVFARENDDNDQTNSRSEQMKTEHSKKQEDRQQSKKKSDDSAKNREDNARAEKQNKCQSRKQGLETKLSRLITNADRHKKHIDDVFTKVQEYKTTNNLTVENYDNLVIKAKTAQEQAQKSVTTLSAMTPSVDCNKDSVASDISTFKAVASQTRDDLKSYRSAVKDLLKAVENAKEASSDDSQTQAQ